MIVKCKFEKIRDVFSKKAPDRDYTVHGYTGFGITKGKLYIVYGVEVSKYSIPSVKFCSNDGIFFYSDSFYYIINDEGDFRPALSFMFDVVCPHLWGNIWCFNHADNDDTFNTLGMLGHEKQVTDFDYADRLIHQGRPDDMKSLARWINIVNDHAVKASCNCCPNIQDIVASAQLSEWYQERINR